MIPTTAREQRQKERRASQNVPPLDSRSLARRAQSARSDIHHRRHCLAKPSRAHSADRWSRGVASYSFTLQANGKDFTITGEDGAIVKRRTNKDDALSPETKQEIARKQWLAVAWDFKQRLENYLTQNPSKCGTHDPFGFTLTGSKRSMGSQQATAVITGGIQTAPSAHTTMGSTSARCP